MFEFDTDDNWLNKKKANLMARLISRYNVMGKMIALSLHESIDHRMARSGHRIESHDHSLSQLI